jgi:hypothetical protein
MKEEYNYTLNIALKTTKLNGNAFIISKRKTLQETIMRITFQKITPLHTSSFPPVLTENILDIRTLPRML